jgi:hypothetical protein
MPIADKSPSQQIVPPLTYADVLKTIRDEIQAEHSLISNRMSWFVMSQSFLMTAYAVSWGQGHTWPIFFHIMLPTLGATLSLIIGQSVSAALGSQSALLKLQAETLNNLENTALDIISIYRQTTCEGKKGGDDFHKKGSRPPRTLPWLFFLIWLIASVWSGFDALARCNCIAVH